MKNYDLDSNFFFTKKEKEETISASDFNSTFKSIGDYFNQILKPFVDSLNSEAVGGIEGSEGYFLSNVGDGSTEWVLLSDSNFRDGTIYSSKLEQSTENSILSSDLDYIFKPAAPAEDYTALSSFYPEEPDLFEDAPPISLSFTKLGSEHLSDNSLSGAEFGILSAANFKDLLFVNTIKKSQIEAKHIAPLNITNAKIADGSIPINKIGSMASTISSLKTAINGSSAGYSSLSSPADLSIINDGAITQSKIEPYSLYVKWTWTGSGYDIKTPFVEGQRFVEGRMLADACLDSRSIFYSFEYSGRTDFPPIFFLQSKLSGANFLEAVQNVSDSDKLNYVGSSDLRNFFDQEVCNAFKAKGVVFTPD